jgi:hypothetical protein
MSTHRHREVFSLSSEDFMNSTHRSRKKTAFVPRIIFQTAAVIGVLPLCAGCIAKSDPASQGVAALGFSTTSGDASLGVANIGFDGSKGDAEFSVANIGFDGSKGDAGLGVANIGFDGSSGDSGLSVANIGFDGSTGDSGLSVAAMGFDASDDALFGVALEAFGNSKG